MLVASVALNKRGRMFTYGVLLPGMATLGHWSSQILTNRTTSESV
jgi:hypothetical protein